MSDDSIAFVGPETVMHDWAVSKATAYSIIRQLNIRLKEEHPTALVVAGKVNKHWYEEACLKKTNEK